jgi:hypothetical protein
MDQSRQQTEQLHPADLQEILERYGELLQTYSNLKVRESIFGNYKRDTKRLEILFPLREHPVHGITGLHVIELYDEAGYVREYHYSWKIIIPKMGKLLNHISAWENESHDAPGTPERFITKTEPHHHHHIPGDRSKRQENWNVRTLEQAFEFIKPYIESEKPYGL